MSTTTSTSKLKIQAVTASGNDGNLPQNVLDGNPNTRWSCFGKGSWLNLDLGVSDVTINEIRIAWYKGDQRKYTFSLNFKAASATTNPSVLNLTSSGTTAQLEKYTSTTQTIVAQHVIITVNGNTVNDWAAITDVAVYGSATVSPPSPPAPTPTPPAAPTTPIPPVAPPTTGQDKFGVKMLYGSKTGGESWYFNPDTFVVKKDPRLTTEIATTEMSKNADGSIKVQKSGQAQNRFYIATSTGYSHNACSQSWDTNLKRGYMQAANDFRNVEITAYIRLNSVWLTSGHSLVWYARSGRHSTSYSCEGSSYKGNIGYNLQSRFQKESGHPNYATTSWKALPTGSTLAFGKWFGYKFCCYDIQNGAAVKLEIWIDAAVNNNWVKVNEKIDTTGWGSTNSCGTTIDQRFMWGAPLCTYRFDMVKDIDWNKMSIREISA